MIFLSRRTLIILSSVNLHVCFSYVTCIQSLLLQCPEHDTYDLLPALLPKQPSHLLSARTPCPCPQLLPFFLWAEGFAVAQSASPWHIRQRCIFPARPAHSASSTTSTASASSTTAVSLPGRCGDAGIRVQRALGGTDGGVAGGN